MRQIIGITKDMREHAKELVVEDKRKGANGLLANEGGILEYYADAIEEIVKDRKYFLTYLLDEYKHSVFCGKNLSDCLDCVNHRECNAIRNVTNLILTGELLKEDEL